MPPFEYACEACGHQWEAEQSIKDAALKTCASCGKNKAKRLVSGGTGFLLKGGGCPFLILCGELARAEV
jgi:putative FmdB family regulatory protein